MNISEGIKNRYQMLMKRRPKSECNTTVAEMACRYTGNIITPPDGVFVADYLMDILDSAEGRAYLQSITPGATYNPWNDSYCIAWAVNKAIGKEVCRVKKVTIEQIADHILDGGAVGIGGGFLSGSTSGHFVCIVGVEKFDKDKIKNIIVDDPYGNYFEGYKNHFNGNDIVFPVDLFKKLTFGNEKTKTVQLYYKEA